MLAERDRGGRKMLRSFAKGGGCRVEGLQKPAEGDVGVSMREQPVGQCIHVCALTGTEAAKAPSADRRAQGVTSRARHRPETGDLFGHGKTDRATGLALLAHRMGSDNRTTVRQQGEDDFEELKRSIGHPRSS